ncbi:hypothetical protein [Homoserinimonas sp. A520]
MSVPAETQADRPTHPRSKRRITFGAFSGALVTALLFAAWAPDPATDTSPAGLREYLEASGDALQVYSLLLAVAATAVAFFSAHLRGVLRRASADTGYGADFVFGGGVLCAAWLLIAAGFTGSLAFSDFAALDDTLLISYWGLGAVGDMVGTAAFVVKGAVMVAASLVILRTRALAAWVGWLGLAFGALTWAALAVDPLFYAGIFAFALWPLAISIAVLFRRR